MMFDKLKELRDYEAKTQRETAGLLGVTRATYAGWESGKDIIPLRKLNELANIYSVSMDYLAGLEQELEKRNQLIDLNNEIISKNIRDIRERNNLSQKELANSINTSQSNIHKYENNKSLITTMYAIELVKNYQSSLDHLIQKTK